MCIRVYVDTPPRSCISTPSGIWYLLWVCVSERWPTSRDNARTHTLAFLQDSRGVHRYTATSSGDPDKSCAMAHTTPGVNNTGMHLEQQPHQQHEQGRQNSIMQTCRNMHNLPPLRFTPSLLVLFCLCSPRTQRHTLRQLITNRTLAHEIQGESRDF